ncbi:MAG: hypothetical protein WCK00_14270, partial [Deltaproteobacteria bacterium]
PANIDAGKSIGVQTLTITKDGAKLADIQVLATDDLTADLSQQTAGSSGGVGGSETTTDTLCPWCPRQWDGSVTVGGDGDGSVPADGSGVGATAHPGSGALPGTGATDVLHPAACPPCSFIK